MAKRVFKRFTCLLLTLVLSMSFITYFPQEIFADELPASETNILDETIGLDVDSHGEEESSDSRSVIEAKASGDPLQSVATVTTGGSASSYVDIDSTYTPSGYATLSTGSGAYVSSPGNYYSYHTSRNGTTSMCPLRQMTFPGRQTRAIRE